jgi:hypothetical protein
MGEIIFQKRGKKRFSLKFFRCIDNVILIAETISFSLVILNLLYARMIDECYIDKMKEINKTNVSLIFV